MAPLRNSCAVCFWPTCFLEFHARYVDVLFSLDGVEQPDFNSEFIASNDSRFTWWKLDAGKAVTNANVFVALNVQIRYVDGSQTMFFM